MLEIRGKLTSGELFINDKYYAVGPTELGFLNLYTLEFILNPHKYNTIVDKSLLDNNVYYFVFMTSYSNSRISCWLIPNNIRVGTWYCIYKGSQLVKTAHSKNELDLDIYYLLYAPKIYYINLFMWNKISNNYETTYKYIKDVFDECDVIVNTLEEDDNNERKRSLIRSCITSTILILLDLFYIIKGIFKMRNLRSFGTLKIYNYNRFFHKPSIFMKNAKLNIK
jgi:hypothetical protein